MSSWRKAFLLALLWLPACGYTLRYRLKDTFSDARGIFVPVFNNFSDEVGAERVFTNALIRELQSRGEIVISSRDQKGLELIGTLTKVDVVPTAYTDRDFKGLASFRRLPSEYGVTVDLSLILRDPKNGQVLWQNGFTGFRRVQPPLDRTYDFQAPSSVGPSTQSIVELRFADVARDIMRDVYDDMVDIF